MTTSYNRSYLFDFNDLDAKQQSWVQSTYFDELSDCHSTMYVILLRDKAEPLPLSMFMRTTNNNFTHGVYSTSAFDGYFITISRDNQECVIAHKYF